MNKVIYAILATIALASCSKSYNITGSSNISLIDGDKLFLSVSNDGERKNLDSCNVVHGKFNLNGSFDSIRIAYIITENPAVPPLPFVLEEGDVNITINTNDMSRRGTELNDTLNSFYTKLGKFSNDYQTLDEKFGKEILEIYSNDQLDVVAKDEEKARAEQNANEVLAEIMKKMEDHYTNFVKANFDNVLGVYIFLEKAIGDTGGYPVLTPWVESILMKAPESFKNNKDIKEFIDNAQKNKNIENGMDTPDVAPIEGTVPAQNNVPTPAEMGGETEKK